MHEQSLALMDAALSRFEHPGRYEVLDVGSYDINGTYRPIVEDRGWRYVGLDLIPGPNVDVVSEDEYRYPFPDGSFDVIISGSTAGHVKNLHLWLAELVRLLVPDGLLVIVAHTWGKPPTRQYDVPMLDLWRFMPDAFQALFDETKQLRDYQIEVQGMDIVASAFKEDNTVIEYGEVIEEEFTVPGPTTYRDTSLSSKKPAKAPAKPKSKQQKKARV